MSNEKVLIVEDEERISRIVTSYLQHAGFVVSVAQNGKEALQLMKKGYDLIILDLMLPDIEGETICSTFRSPRTFHHHPLRRRALRMKGCVVSDWARRLCGETFQPARARARVKAHLRRSREKTNKLFLLIACGLIVLSLP
jgi:DNA-binding response OmpR family regulator